MGERTVRIRKVAGSIPVRSTKNAAHRFRLAKFVRPRFFHRGIIPLLTLFFSASGSQKTAVTPLEDSGRCHSACRPLRGDQFPDDPRWLSGQAGAFCSLTALSRRNHAPRQTHPASWERQRTAPRRGTPYLFTFHSSLFTRPAGAQGGCVLSAFYYNKSISRLIHLHFHRRA